MIQLKEWVNVAFEKGLIDMFTETVKFQSR